MENFDKNNTMVLKLGPDEIKQILHSQVGFYKDKEKRDPKLLYAWYCYCYNIRPNISIYT